MLKESVPFPARWDWPRIYGIAGFEAADDPLEKVSRDGSWKAREHLGETLALSAGR